MGGAIRPAAAGTIASREERGAVTAPAPALTPNVSPHDAPVGSALRRLRRLTIIAPALFISAVEVGVHVGLAPLLPGWLEILLTLAAVLMGTALFSLFVFAVVRRIQNRLVERHRQLAAVQAASLSLASEMALEPLLLKFVELAREITNARYGALAIIEPDGSLADFITSGIDAGAHDRIDHPPIRAGILGAIHGGEIVRIRDIDADPRSAGFPRFHPHMKTLLGVPLRHKHTIVGQLYLTEKQGAEEFTSEDEAMVRLFASQAAISIENARLLEQSHDLGILEERERIGMDLHDGVIQSLYGVNLNLEECVAAAREDPDFVQSQLERAVDDLNKVIRDIRRYIFHLRPAAFSGNTLDDALVDLANEMRINTMIDVEIETDEVDARTIPDDVAENLFHIAQEALANIAKHSRATHARVALVDADGALELIIEDNGRGFEVSTRLGIGHRGLGNMMDRARAIGATLKIDSAAGKGTVIHVRSERSTSCLNRFAS
jgi:signal transduction histidine kinase